MMTMIIVPVRIVIIMARMAKIVMIIITTPMVIK